MVRKYKADPETAAKDMNAPLELVLEGLKKQVPVQAQIASILGDNYLICAVSIQYVELFSAITQAKTALSVPLP